MQPAKPLVLLWPASLVIISAGSAFSGCGNASNTPSFYTTSGSGGAVQATTGNGGAQASKPTCVPAADGARPHEAGNYDNRSCNSTGCHEDYVGGGWVYSSRRGPPWVGGATITITNSDGSTVTSVSAEDGFFFIEDEVSSPYTVCVSKCPGVDCNLTPHLSADCQTSNCHGNPVQRIYVSDNSGGSGGAGGSSSSGDGECTPAASGGPYTHTEFVFGNQPCSGPGCHRDPKPVYKGGYLYDGPESVKTVAEATITLTPRTGTPVTAVTGPDGMFFFGSVGATIKTTPFSAPYTACVSKCPLLKCSEEYSHTTTDDCQSSNCHGSVEAKIYLD